MGNLNNIMWQLYKSEPTTIELFFVLLFVTVAASACLCNDFPELILQSLYYLTQLQSSEKLIFIHIFPSVLISFMDK